MHANMSTVHIIYILISGTLFYYNSNFSSKLNYTLFPCWYAGQKENNTQYLIYINCKILIYTGTLYLLFISLYNFSFPPILFFDINKDFFLFNICSETFFVVLHPFRNISLTCNIFSCKAALHNTKCQLTVS